MQSTLLAFEPKTSLPHARMTLLRPDSGAPRDAKRARWTTCASQGNDGARGDFTRHIRRGRRSRLGHGTGRALLAARQATASAWLSVWLVTPSFQPAIAEWFSAGKAAPQDASVVRAGPKVCLQLLADDARRRL